MKSIGPLNILFLGVGEMGKAVLTGMLESDTVSSSQITLITGTSAGKDAASIHEHCQQTGIDVNELTCIPRNEVQISSLTPPDVMILGMKPHQMQEAMEVYAPLIKEDTVIITMAAGKPLSDYQSYIDTHPKIIRIMPHIPKATYAVYGEDAQAITLTQTLCSGVGEAVVLESEDQMHAFTAVAGSPPAFIAQFIGSFEGREAQQAAIKELLMLIQGSSNVSQKCTDFHDSYLTTAQELLGQELGAKAMRLTLRGTLNELQQNDLSPEDYIAKVRSKKGTTNAGLLFMGSPPPQTEEWGTPEQLAAQNAIAEGVGQTTPPENAITHAMLACEQRSRGMAEDVMDPLWGVDIP